jgi:hypothetical protein
MPLYIPMPVCIRMPVYIPMGSLSTAEPQRLIGLRSPVRPIGAHYLVRRRVVAGRRSRGTLMMNCAMDPLIALSVPWTIVIVAAPIGVNRERHNGNTERRSV